MQSRSQTQTVLALGTAQTLAWASSYYLPAMLAVPMAKDLGVSTPTVFAAFSAALLVSALLGPHVGRAIDRWGGRPLLMGTSAVFAVGLGLLGTAQGIVDLFVAWLVLGIAMGCGLYDAAFSALVRLYGHGSRKAITGITLIAGFASTVGWPLSTLLESQFGWRGACLAWAAMHLVIGLPLNSSLPGTAASTRAGPSPEAPLPPPPAAVDPTRTALLLSFVFAATWFISTAMAAHLPRLLQASGATPAAAVTIGALVGPAQVAGRLLEFGLLKRVHPMLSARLAALMHPIGAVILLAMGAHGAALFAILHGTGNGILTIAKGTLPLLLFGPQGYGHRQGVLTVPARMAQAVSPWLFGVFLDRWGAQALWVSAMLGATAFAALMLFPKGAKAVLE